MPDFYNGEASGKESFSDSTDNNPLEEYSQEVQGIVEDLPAEENIFSSEYDFLYNLLQLHYFSVTGKSQAYFLR